MLGDSASGVELAVSCRSDESMWEHGFSYPPGEPGHIHMVVADAVKQSRSDRGRLRPRPGTGIPSHKTKPIHGRGEITSVPL